MKKNLFFCCFGLLLLLISCNKIGGDAQYFNGEIIYIENIPETNTLEGEQIYLDEIDAGEIAVYDSLLFFWYWNFPNAFFSVFDLTNFKHIGYFCPKGDGPNETQGVPPIYQFYEENGDLKTMLLAPNDSELRVWNITKSLQENTTIFDTIVSNKWYMEHLTPYLRVSHLSEDSYMGYIPPRYKSFDDILPTLPVYEKRTIYSDKLIKKYHLFRDSIENDSRIVDSDRFFTSADCIKPDGTKIAQGMTRLCQLNIVDLEKETISGYRIKGTPDFSIFKTDMSNTKYYYSKAHCDDTYIYALYAGVENEKLEEFQGFDILHIFDWEGNFVKKIRLTYPVRSIWYDKINEFLYGYNDIKEELYRFHFKGLI